MNKILYKLVILLVVFTSSLSLSFAQSEKQNQTQAFQTVFKDDKALLSTELHLLEIPKELDEISVTATLPDYPWVRVSEYRGYLREKCVSCHGGISPIGKSHPLSFGCTVCHGGNGDSDIKELAHATLIYDPEAKTGKRNPSSFSVVDKTCGQAYCHSGHSQKDRNHIERVKKSMMGTLAGMISGLRYQWGAQGNREAKYGVHAI